MATFTREGLFQIVRGSLLVEEAANNNEEKIRNAVNAIMTNLVADGLIYLDTKKTHTSGRAEHEYSANNLYPRLFNFVKDLRRDSLMWVVGNTILDHLEFLGYEMTDDEVISRKDLTDSDISYIKIFGEEAFKEKKKREEDAKKHKNPWEALNED
jgi:hypothetical protein